MDDPCQTEIDRNVKSIDGGGCDDDDCHSTPCNAIYFHGAE